LYIFLIIFVIIGGVYALNALLRSIDGYDEMALVNHIDGIPNLGKGVSVWFVLYPKKVIINKQQTIPISRIKGIEFLSQKEIVESGKSTIGRGILGTFIAGPLGGIIGAASGIGTQKSQEVVFYLIIQYVNIKGEESTAVFTSGIMYSDAIKKISNMINERIGYVPERKLRYNGNPYEI